MNSEPVSVVADFKQFLDRQLNQGIASIWPLRDAHFVAHSDVRDYLKPDVIGNILASKHIPHPGNTICAIQNEFQLVFTILAYIGELAYLPQFLANRLADNKLPFLHEEEWDAAPDCRKFFAAFSAAQWKFCAQRLDRNQPNNFRIHDKAILPMRILEELKHGPDSFTYKIWVHPAYTNLVQKVSMQSLSTVNHTDAYTPG